MQDHSIVQYLYCRIKCMANDALKEGKHKQGTIGTSAENNTDIFAVNKLRLNCRRRTYKISVVQRLKDLNKKGCIVHIISRLSNQL